MKLLIIAPVIYPVHPDNRYAGIEKLAGYFAAGLNALGHQVTVAAGVGSAFPRGIRHIPVQLGDFVQGELVAWHVYRPEIRGFDAILDFSHGHFAMREMDLPAVSWVWHDPKVMQPPQPAYNVLALSQWQADRLLQYQKVKARVFDCHCGFPVNSDQVGDHFVFIGQATPTKGLLQAVELCRELGVPLDAIGAVRAGDEAYFEQCQAAAGPLTEFWGEVSEPVKISLLARAKGLVHSLAKDYCLPEGELIMGNPALRPIQELSEGSRVLSHDGCWHTVTRTFRRAYTGPLVEIIPCVINIPVRVTPEHRVLAVRKAICSRGDNSINICTPKRSCPFCRRRLWQQYKPTWLPAGSLQKGDFLLTPVPQEQKETEIFGMELSADLARFCGYYVAEGSTNQKGVVCLDFGKGEKEWAEDVRDTVQRLFSRHVSFVGARNLRAQFGHIKLARFLREEFGCPATKKRVPLWLFQATDPIVAEFLKGAWRGDGCRYEAYRGYPVFAYSTASRTLATQFVLLLARLGIIASLTATPQSKSAFSKGNTIYRLRLTGRNRILFGKLLDMPQLDASHRQTYKAFLHEGFLWLPIKECREVTYEGPVFNLEVESANSYLSGFASLHNCEAHSHKCVDSLLAGVPVVSYSSGAMPEVVEHGVDGFLVNTREEFKDAMLHVDLLDRALIRERAIARWGVRNVTERAVALMREVAGGLRW